MSRRRNKSRRKPRTGAAVIANKAPALPPFPGTRTGRIREPLAFMDFETYNFAAKKLSVDIDARILDGIDYATPEVRILSAMKNKCDIYAALLERIMTEPPVFGGPRLSGKHHALAMGYGLSSKPDQSAHVMVIDGKITQVVIDPLRYHKD